MVYSSGLLKFLLIGSLNYSCEKLSSVSCIVSVASLLFVNKTETRLKRLSVFKAAHRLTAVFAQFHRNLKLLQHICKTFEGSARYCKILYEYPDLLTVILMLNSANRSLV